MALVLTSISSIQELCRTEHEQIYLQRAFWLLYSIEKFYSLRLGRYSVRIFPLIIPQDLTSNVNVWKRIEDDSIDHQPPTQVPGRRNSSPFSQLWDVHEVELDRLLLQCRFAKICHLITKQLYTPSGLQKSPSQLSCSISQLSALLKQWKDSIPSSHKPLDAGTSSNYPHALSSATQECLHLSYQYYEALLAIHGRWQLTDPFHLTAEDMKSFGQSRETCSSVARMALLMSSEIRLKELFSDWSVLFCISLARGLTANLL